MQLGATESSQYLGVPKFPRIRDMPKVLVGLAVTADSDDTDGKILAAIQDLQIR